MRAVSLRVRLTVGALLAIVLAAIPAAAQSTATLVGAVTDSSGASRTVAGEWVCA